MASPDIQPTNDEIKQLFDMSLQSDSEFFLLLLETCIQSGGITASRLHQVLNTDPHKPALLLI